MRRAAEVVAGMTLDLEFADGHRPARAEDEMAHTPADKPRVATKSRPDKAVKKSEQGSLF